MLRNNFKIAFRSLLQNKVYSTINLMGLAIALSIVLLISLYVKDDLSFDRFHANGHRIFRLVSDLTNSKGEIRKMGNTGFIQGPTFKEEVPEIASYCRFRNGWNTLVKKENEAFKEDLMYADNSVFSMFTIHVIDGDINTALSKINSIVITAEVAEKYFNSKDVIGKTLYVGDLAEEMVPFEVTAVIKSLPTNSSVQFDLLCNIEYRIKKDQIDVGSQSWYNASLNTFVMLHENSKVDPVSKKINQVTQSHVKKEIQTEKESDPSAKPFVLQYKLQPLFDMHLDPEYYASNGMKHWSDIKYPRILSGIAFLLIFIASINFINLTLARSLQRSKEIGIRKTTGSTRWQLFLQFLIESMFTTLIAAIPAFILAYSMMPAFSELTGKYLHEQILFSSETILLYMALCLLIAFFAGGYPAFVMSGFQPIESLKGKAIIGTNHRLRQSLVVFQFTVAGVLMIGTAFLTQQFQYIKSQPLGFETTDRYRFWLPWDEISSIGSSFKAELRKNNNIEMVSSKSGDFNMTKYRIEGEETNWIYYEHIDDQHLQLLKIPLITGRYFSSKFSMDTSSNIIINESFVKKILPKGVDPLEYPLKSNEITYNIVGVVRDFHYAGFKEKINPMVFMLDKGSQAGMVHIQTKKGRNKEAIAAVQSVYKKFVPFLPMEYESLEEFKMKRYAEEIREKKIVNFTAVLALIIACLGLFGLSTFMTEQRTKEIGIRKILGAGISGVAILLSKDFIKLVILSIIISIPIGYYFVQQWLENFIYRIEIEWWVFALVALLGIFISFCTVFYQSMRTALTNPVQCLKSE